MTRETNKALTSLIQAEFKVPKGLSEGDIALIVEASEPEIVGIMVTHFSLSLFTRVKLFSAIRAVIESYVFFEAKGAKTGGDE